MVLKMVCYTEQQHSVTLAEFEKKNNEIHTNLNGCKHRISAKNEGFEEEQPSPRIASKEELFEKIPIVVYLITYIGYLVLFVIGFCREFLRKYGLEEQIVKEKSREVCVYDFLV